MNIETEVINYVSMTKMYDKCKTWERVNSIYYLMRQWMEEHIGRNHVEWWNAGPVDIRFGEHYSLRSRMYFEDPADATAFYFAFYKELT